MVGAPIRDDRDDAGGDKRRGALVARWKRRQSVEDSRVKVDGQKGGTRFSPKQRQQKKGLGYEGLGHFSAR